MPSLFIVAYDECHRLMPSTAGIRIPPLLVGGKFYSVDRIQRRAEGGPEQGRADLWFYPFDPKRTYDATESTDLWSTDSAFYGMTGAWSRETYIAGVLGRGLPDVRR